MRDPELERLVIEVMGGMEQVRKIADLPSLHTDPKLDVLRELARYLLEEEQ